MLEDLSGINQVENKWIPKERGHSLYIRPLIYRYRNFLGVHPSATYRMILMLSHLSCVSKRIKSSKNQSRSKPHRAVRGELELSKNMLTIHSLYADRHKRMDILAFPLA